MTDINDPHAPTPEFRASLKHELHRVRRAERQFGASRNTNVRRLGTVIGLTMGGVVMLTIGLVLGAGTSSASAEVADGVYREAVPRSALSILREPIRNAITALSCAIAPSAEPVHAPLAALQAPPVQQGVPVVNVVPITGKTTTTLGAVLGVRELPGGRLLVNDAARRQIKVLDSTLAAGGIRSASLSNEPIFVVDGIRMSSNNATVALDSVAGASNSYGPRPASIVRYLGDSTLLTDFVSRSVLVLDHNGQIARALALPTYEDGVAPFAVTFPTPRAIDDKGRVLAQGGFSVRNGQVADSSLILRADLQTRRVDVVGAMHSPGGRNRTDPPEDGRRVVTTIRQPVPTEDSWSVLSDGTIAFVRGNDYHVDWILPDGTRSSTSKLPFDWKRLTDEDKQRLADSAKVVWDSLMAMRNARNTGSSNAGRGDEGGGGAGRSGGGGGALGQQGSIQRMQSVPLPEIPDFYPPIHPNASIPDLDGNLWILPTTSAQSQRGELVYDVVNVKRGLFQRVRMPVGRSVAGFGKGGVVYLLSGDRTNGFHLERARIDVAKPASTPK
jgi:uncharacterized membrane protein YgcG